MTSHQPAPAGLPAPFVVEPTFRMRPGLARLEGPICDPDPVAAAASRAQVQRALGLRRLPLGLWQSSDLGLALREAHERLPVDSNDGPLGEAGTAKLDFSREPASHLLHLRLSVPDDLVLMAPGESARAVALAVAMPSGWDPAEKLGLDFAQIHRPVPDAPALVNSAASLSQMILNGGPYRRYVWTLSDNPHLSQHPLDAERDENETAADSIWYRVEQQTTVPLPASGYCLFLIRVWHLPLEEVLQADAQRPAVLRDALESMSDAVIDYKNLQHLRPAALAMLT